MPSSWNRLAESTDGDYAVDDFKQAMYQIVTQQCLYSRFFHQAVAYRLISKFRHDFKEGLELLGLKLAFNDRLNFCYVTQEVAKPTQMDSKDTKFLLVLRHMYHVHAIAGDLTPDGDAVVNLAELEESYKGLTGGQQLEMKRSHLTGLMKMAQRSGLAKEIVAPDDDIQNFAIAILPGIAEVLSEYAINRFGASLKASLVGKTPAAKPDANAVDIVPESDPDQVSDSSESTAEEVTQ